MKGKLRTGATGIATAAIIGVLANGFPAHRTLARTANTSVAARPAASSHKCVVAIGSGDSAFVRNFNPYSGGMDFTKGAIYEPLIVYSSGGGGQKYNWLATHIRYSKDVKTLTITVRQGVKWSDGKPFTADDVLFTLAQAPKINPAMDQIGVSAQDSNIASIKKSGWNIIIKFHKRDSTFLGTLNNVFVVPKHVWTKINGDPTKFLNPNPVGTGPFTKVQSFNSQDYVLGKNKYYWQKGKPAVPCLERLSAATNDSALLAQIHGDADWSHNFYPNAADVYDAKDPKDYHYFYGKTAPVGMFFDDTKYPYSIAKFRQALSMAVDRQKVYKVGEYGYEPPSDAVGIGAQYKSWLDPKLAKTNKSLVTYKPSAAKALLKQAGFTWNSSGALIDPKGTPVTMEFHVIAGWSDWVLSLQIITDELKAIGIDASEKLDPDWGTWVSTAPSSKQPHLMWTYSGGPTPYEYYHSNLDKTAFTPSGQDAWGTGNWEHFYDPTATKLLSDFRKSAKKKDQMAINYKLQSIFMKDMPYVPVVYSAIWYTYSTKYFVGWPTKKNNYANGQFSVYPDDTVVLTRLAPKK